MLRANLVVFTTVLFSVVLCSSGNGQASERQNDHHQESSLDRQWGDPSFLMPNMFLSTLMPLSILIGIGIILVKLFILGLWIYGRSGGAYSSYSTAYPGYGALTTAYSNGWRGDSSSARSMADRNGLPIPSYIGSKVLALVSKVTEALEKMEKRQAEKRS